MATTQPVAPSREGDRQRVARRKLHSLLEQFKRHLFRGRVDR
jgi:hypothetical protein